MTAWIIYTIGTFVTGLLLSLIISFFSGGPTKQNEKPLRIVIVCLVLCMGGPFAYTEALTRIYGKPMEHTLKVVYNDSPVFGEMDYYKVTKCYANKASVYIVGKDQYGGMVDRPVLQVDLVKEGGQWKADSYRIVTSARFNKDDITFPPYG